MSEFFTSTILESHIPDDLTIPQFFLDSTHPLQLTRSHDIPLFIDDLSGKKVWMDETRIRVAHLANGMSRKLGINDGDVACVLSPNDLEYPVVIWALHRLGAVMSGANPTYMADELVHQLKITNSRTVFVHPMFVEMAKKACKTANVTTDRIVIMGTKPSGSSFLTVDELVTDGANHKTNFVEKRLGPGEAKTKLAFLCMSSGTTGPPKAVAIAHHSVIANVIQISAHNTTASVKLGIPPEKRRFCSGDIVSLVLPMFHIFGLILNLHVTLFNAGALVVMPKFGWPDFCESIQRHKITHLMVVPPMLVLLTKHPLTKKFDLSTVRFCFGGGAPLSGDLIKATSILFPGASVGQGYGMTETATSVSMTSASQLVGLSGGAGTMLPGVKARVIKADGSLAKPREPGELVVFSPSNALGYYGNKKATEETFLPDGYVRTGDEVYINEEGEIFVVDRIKELIKVRGYQVAPAELEAFLLTHPDVADVCVVGIPDDYSGELPFAFVVLHQSSVARAKGNTREMQTIKDSISKYVADNKVSYKRLEGGLEFVDAIPKNASGKLLRRVLRDQVKAKRENAKNKAKL